MYIYTYIYMYICIYTHTYQIFPDLYSKLLKAMQPLMAADCADASAPAVLTLHSSKHAVERAMVSADNFDDDDDAAAPVSATKALSDRARLSQRHVSSSSDLSLATKALSDRARLSGGQREARNVKKSVPNAKPRAGGERPPSAEQVSAPLGPLGVGEGDIAGHDRDLAVDVLAGDHMNGWSRVVGGCVGMEALLVACAGSLAVGLVAGMVLPRR
jgi:hypothetical protein